MRAWVSVLLIVPIACSAAPDIVIADFEGPDYSGWTATGDAFGQGPAKGTLPNQMAVSGFEGGGLVNSYLNGDGTQGTLTSPEFKIQRKYINFLMGGGNLPDAVYMNLLVDGKKVYSATGGNEERLTWRSWDVRKWKGKKARLEIVDKATGGWGHINVDQIIQSKQSKQEQIMATKLYDEMYRPQFHFSPKKNWTNDPNGLVYYQGEYHLFFQHNPLGINWGNMHWGHAVSKDLVHWEELSIALAPDEHGTCFSGSAVVDWNNTSGLQTGAEKVLIALYTGAPVPEVEGGPKFSQCLAYSNDRGRTWTTYDKNPVLAHIVGGNRDPKVFWHTPTGKWVMALYLDGNEFGFFGSPNLKEWSLLSKITVAGSSECPDLFELPIDGNPASTKWIFLGGDGNYLIGTFDGVTFTPESEKLEADWGAQYYATQSYSDIPKEDGRRIQIAWMNGGQYPRMPFNQQMNFPCELTLRTFPEGLRVRRLPVREITSLYDKKLSWADVTVNPGENILKGVKEELVDVSLEVELAGAEAFSLKLHGESVQYSVKDKTLTCLGKTAPVEAVDGRIKLRALVDRASIEVFANDGKVVMSSCFLPEPKNKSLEFFTVGGPVKIVVMDVNSLKSSWKK
ncbi:MAG TPA: glycoside hydrolase family 32 protein [Candidatus Hydrogenedentes bacterium]|nr:glycoside hydrolase family 32 protein [Candidatus Hydrogenedentota bacterium]